MFLQFYITDRMRAQFYVSEDASHSFQKKIFFLSSWDCFFHPSRPLPTESLPLMFLSLSLLCLFYSCFSRDCSQETFLEKPQGTDFLCASGQQTVCVLLAAAVLPPPWGLRERLHLRKMRLGVGHKVKPTRRKRQTVAGPGPPQ